MKSRAPLVPANAEKEITALIATLHDTGQRLEELTRGEVDTFIDRSGRTYLLRGVQDRLRHAEDARQAAVLNALPANIAMLDTHGVILSVNEAWSSFGAANMLLSPGHAVGINYLDVCDKSTGENATESTRAADGIRSVLAGGRASFSLEYPCDAPAERRWFLMTATPLAGKPPGGAVVMHMDITDRKRAEEEQLAAQSKLAESEQRLRLIIDTEPECVKVVSKDMGLLDMNAAGLALLEADSLDAAKARPLLDFIAPEHRAAFADLHARVMRGESGTVEFQVVGLKGGRRWLETHAAPLIGRDGKAASQLAVTRDVTARKEADEQIRRGSEALRRFSSAMDATADAIYLVDRSTMQFIHVNAAACRMQGLTREELLALGPAGVLGIPREELERTYDAIIASGSDAQPMELLRRRKDGTQAWVELRRHAQRSGDGWAIVTLVRDITDRKQAAQELRESERRFSDMLANVEMVAVMLDPQVRVTYCNDHLLRLTGRQRDEVIGGDWVALFMPPEAESAKDRVASILAGKPGTAHTENLIVSRAGERRMIRWSHSVLRSGAGEVVGMASIGEDITERKAAEEILKKRAVELERFHRLSVGRELQMVELKKRINELAVQAGQKPPYDLAFAAPDSTAARQSHDDAT